MIGPSMVIQCRFAEILRQPLQKTDVITTSGAAELYKQMPLQVPTDTDVVGMSMTPTNHLGTSM
jgi:hypothetical protein